MDTITQGLLGAATAQCGFRQKIGRDATWAAFVAGVLPDGDIFFSRVSEWFGNGRFMDGLRYHRGWTHSLVAIPVLALLVAGAWWALRRWRLRRGGVSRRGSPVGFGWLYACCFVAVATHGLLDACTSYGTQLLWPFSTNRLAWDCVPIIDLIYTPLLILTLVLCYAARKIWRRPERAARVSLAVGVVGMVLSTGYLAAGRVCHDIARYRGLETVGDRQILSAEAYPMFGSIFLWRVVVQTPKDWYVLRVHLFGDKRKDRKMMSRAAKLTPEPPEVHRARQTEAYALFDWFARGQVRTDAHREDKAVIVEFHDMRYGRRAASPEGLWLLRFRFSPGQTTPVEITRPRSTPRRGVIVREYWRDLWNP
ncbi:MAG: metal-dependent hydrolase [Phycisphaerae bacterium]|nr:metal-dependent hydrolase [Phycisphaerae bacterium]